jgi:hypothetical protein
MKRKLKQIVLVPIASLIMTAGISSVAQAQFTSSAMHTVYSSSQLEAHKFTLGSGIGGIGCEVATFAGTGEGTSVAAQTMQPIYAKCLNSLGQTVDITTNTLTYEFLSGTHKGKLAVTGDIQMTVTANPHCIITISGPQLFNGVTYTNNSNGSVTVTTNTTNIHSAISGGFFSCGTLATTSTAGTYTSKTLLKGNGGAATISVD